MFDLLIADGILVEADGAHAVDLAIGAGRVAAWLAPGETVPARERIDASGLTLLPGLVDAHVHLREPGLVHKEGFASGTRAALAGVIPPCWLLPTDDPLTLTPGQFAEKRRLAEASAHCDVALQAGLGPDLTHVPALAELGAVSFEIFLADLPPALLIEDDATLLAALAAVAEVGGIAGVSHGSEPVVRARLARLQREAPDDPLSFARSRPPIAEALGIARACLAAAETGARVHIRQVSSAAGLEALALGRAAGVSSEVTPHNLLLTEAELTRQGVWAKVAPPLRPAADAAAMQQALAERRIDIVATDHAPHLEREKTAHGTDIWKAPGGFPGLQCFLPVMLSAVEAGQLSLSDLVRTCATAPAQLFGLHPQKGTLRPGADADLVAIDLARRWTVRNEDQLSKARITPFDGLSAAGAPAFALMRGQLAMRDGRLAEMLPAGRFLRPAG